MSNVSIDPAILLEAAQLIDDCRLRFDPLGFSAVESDEAHKRHTNELALINHCDALSSWLREAADQAGEESIIAAWKEYNVVQCEYDYALKEGSDTDVTTKDVTMAWRKVDDMINGRQVEPTTQGATNE